MFPTLPYISGAGAIQTRIHNKGLPQVREVDIKMLKSRGHLKLINFSVVDLIVFLGDQTFWSQEKLVVWSGKGQGNVREIDIELDRSYEDYCNSQIWRHGSSLPLTYELQVRGREAQWRRIWEF